MEDKIAIRIVKIIKFFQRLVNAFKYAWDNSSLLHIAVGGIGTAALITVFYYFIYYMGIALGWL